MTRTTKGLVLALAVTAGVVVPAAGAARQRTEIAPYERPSGVHLEDYVWFEVTGPDGLPEARPAPGETAVSIVIEDESGRPVAGEVHQGKRELGVICGASDAPLPLAGRQPVHVHVYFGTGCSDLTVPTTGTVTFTFTK